LGGVKPANIVTLTFSFWEKIMVSWTGMVSKEVALASWMKFVSKPTLSKSLEPSESKNSPVMGGGWFITQLTI
jgi:hypothetical protein